METNKAVHVPKGLAVALLHMIFLFHGETSPEMAKPVNTELRIFILVFLKLFLGKFECMADVILGILGCRPQPEVQVSITLAVVVRVLCATFPGHEADVQEST